MGRSTLIVIFCVLFATTICAQPKGESIFSFAFLSDIHIAKGAKSVDDAILCVEDINKNEGIEFSIIAGDITEFGSDEEIVLAKSIFDKLNKPYYIVAGNHDAKWSESGCNTFVKVFGYEGFEFEKGQIKFIGTNSGPNMRMAPALVPRETIVWLDSLSKEIDPRQPVIFINHYPMDSSVLNYSRVLSVLKKMNTQLIMNGHWHQNRAMIYEGIPGVIGRSSMATGKDGPGYTIVNVIESAVTFSERVVVKQKDGQTIGNGFVSSPWHTLRMSRGVPLDSNIKYLGPNFSVNKEYPFVHEVWKAEDNTDIGSGAIMYGNYVVYANTAGVIYALDATNGKQLWSYKTAGKIFSTPAIDGSYVVIGSTDGNIYSLNLKTGVLFWRVKCEKSVLGSPTIFNGTVYIGASDGIFRALNLKTGKKEWSFTQIKGFIEAKPFVDREQVVIGDWANTLYSLNPKSGKLQWLWSNKGSRMYSPAAVWPIKANEKIFFTTPERVSYALDAKTGEQLWRIRGGRESIGLSPNGKQYYIKTMKDSVFAFSTEQPQLQWQTNCGFGYEIAPTPITSIAKEGKNGKGLIFIPTDKGNIIALNVADGSIAWKHKLSLALINYIQPLGNNKILVSTMDGVVAVLAY
ncbi:MAG: PQQ-binding-like beta-propeller repeat protein [Bacteroidales bacterium]